MDTVMVDRHIWVYPNRKPWMNQEVQQLLKERKTTFRSADRALYCMACGNLKRYQKGKVGLQEEDGGPSGQQQQQAGVAASPAARQLQD